MQIFAHRGFSLQYPENTMTAFRKALEAGADGIEMDARLTQDSQIVIMHDPTIDRTTNGKGKVRNMLLPGSKRALCLKMSAFPCLSRFLRNWAESCC